MDVSEHKLHQILEGSKQYQVPLYQRTYSWEKKQLKRLWDDVKDLAKARRDKPFSTHFTGSLVLAVNGVTAGSSKMLVVDGQQRLTTLTLLLAALRDLLKSAYPDDPKKYESISKRYLVDEYNSGDDRLKILPTQGDRSSYRGVIDEQMQGLNEDNVISAYNFFFEHLKPIVEGNDSTTYLEVQDAVLHGLDFVSITAGEGDNVYRIFESLNNTGLRLTQGDLLRNYIFMRLGTVGEQLYSSVWMPMQNRLTPKDLEKLFWIELTWYDSEVKQGDMYEGQVLRLKDLSVDEIRRLVKIFNDLSVLMATMRDPSLEKDATVQRQLSRLREYGMPSTDPLVLRLLYLRSVSKVDSDDVAGALKVLESFLVRRLLVSAPHNALSRMMLRASDELDETSLEESLRRYLSFGRKRFATNEQIERAVVEEAFYYVGKHGQRKTVLAWIEEAIAGKEPADLSRTSIEHIMPQNIVHWREDLNRELGQFESVDEMHDALVHTLANLSLTGYNSELSNSPFAVKRKMLEKSNVALNDFVSSREFWGKPEIEERGKYLASIINSEWVSPINSSENQREVIDEISMKDALSAIPNGQWATFGDIAAVLGTSPSAVEDFLSSNRLAHAWRVRKASGAEGPHKFVSPGLTESDGATLLAASGVHVDSSGHAQLSHRVEVRRLIEATSIDSISEQVNSNSTLDSLEMVRSNLSAKLSPPVWQAVERILLVWLGMGGQIFLNASGDETAGLQLVHGVNEERSFVTLSPAASGQVNLSIGEHEISAPLTREGVVEILGYLEGGIVDPLGGANDELSAAWLDGGRNGMSTVLVDLAQISGASPR